MNATMVKNGDFTPFMEKLVDETTGKFQYAYCREDLTAMHAAMERAKGSSGYASRRENLLRCLSESGLECSPETDAAQLSALISQVPTREECCRMLLEELYAIYRQFPTAQDYMARLVRRLGDPEFAGDSVRLAIVKQFIKYTDYNTAPIKTHAREIYGLTPTQAKDTQALLQVMDERIFDILETISTMDKAHKRDARRKFALLKLADDLAFGRFRTNGKTKTDLYMFAFAFHMTVYTGAFGDPEQPDRDIAKNLFRDYYQDNLLRYISEDYIRNFRMYDSEPTGEGINYKNYAEIIYIYFLRKSQEEMDARKRIKRANLLIDKCFQMAQAREKENKQPSKKEWLITDDYNAMFTDVMWSMTEEELAEYLCEHFEIPTQVRDKARITAQWEEYAALNNYLEIMDLDLSSDAVGERISTPLFDSSVIDQMGFDSGFTGLLAKMEQLLQLRRPSAAAAYACVLEQEGNSDCAQRLLTAAAGLDCLVARLRAAAQHPEQAAENRKILYQQLTDAFGINKLKEAGDIPNKALLCQIRDHLSGIRTSVHRVDTAHDRLADLAKRTVNNFRKRTRGLRCDMPDHRDYLTVCANLTEITAQIPSLLKLAAQEEQAMACLSEDLNQDLQTLSELTGTSLTVAPDAGWCSRYAEELRSLQTGLLNLLPGWMTAVFTPQETPWVLPPDVEKALASYREEQSYFTRISRTALIAAHYHQFIYNDQTEHTSMPQLLAEFCAAANPVLDACRYQRISQKNLFDMFTIFSLYYSINIEK